MKLPAACALYVYSNIAFIQNQSTYCHMKITPAHMIMQV